MSIEKLIKKLSNYLNGKKKTIKEHCDDIHDLIKELEQKRDKLKSKLDKENSKSKRKQLKIELKIIKVELSKAEEKLTSLKH